MLRFFRLKQLSVKIKIMITDKLNPEYRFSSLLLISPEWMRRQGYGALLTDIDNTLLPRNSYVVPQKQIDWLKLMLDRGILIVLASNNGGKRVEKIRAQLKDNEIDIPILEWAGKPLPRAYSGAIKMLEKHMPHEILPSVLAAGDQLFTDVLGAHMSGLPAVWLQPLSHNDFIGTKFLRLLEKAVVFYLQRSGQLPEENNIEYSNLESRV